MNLMTIHKSKGLEFKYVFILNIDKKFSIQDLMSPLILSRQNGAGIKYLADMKGELETDVSQQSRLAWIPCLTSSISVNCA